MSSYKYSVVGIVGLPANYGGFETLVENLVEYDEGDKIEDILVFCSSKNYSIKKDTYKRAKLKYLPIKANGVSSILYDVISILWSVIYSPKSILILGVSGAIVLPLVKVIYKGKIVTNIDGLEWRRDKWGKFAKKYLKLSEKIAVKYSDTIIADNSAITDYVKKEYSVDAKTIAYGGDHALRAVSTVAVQEQFALSICRIEPENNIHLILDAFSKSRVNIKFIGNWDSSEYGLNLKSKYDVFDNIELIDPSYDLDYLARLREMCYIYVHGHSAGGTNPSLVEMMHFSKLILCFDCSYNRATTEGKAIYFNNATELCELLNSNLSEYSNGTYMYEIANRKYKWSIIKKEYEELLGCSR